LLQAAARGGECLARAEFMRPSSRRAFCSRAPAGRVAPCFSSCIVTATARGLPALRHSSSIAGAVVFPRLPSPEVSFLVGATRRNVLQWLIELSFNCSLWPASCASPMRPGAPCAFLLAGYLVTCIFASAPTLGEPLPSRDRPRTPPRHRRDTPISI
jgi:hypothetical protein